MVKNIGGELGVGLPPEFRSEKILRNLFGTVFVILQKKMLISSHSQVRGRTNSEARNGTEFRKQKLILQNSQNYLTK